MKTVFAIVALAIAALYLYNNKPPQADHVGKDEAASSHSPIITIAGSSTLSFRSQTAMKVPQTAPKIVEAAPSAPRSTSIVVAPMPKIGLKTGPNAQTDLKTGPNAQNDWTAPSRLKTGPNAQTDLKTGPNAQNNWSAQSTLKTGPNAQTDLTLKRSW